MTQVKKNNKYLNKHSIKSLFLLMLFFVFLNLYYTCYARKSDEFIDFLSSIIYEDCKGNSINIKKGLLIYKDTGQNIVDFEDYDIDTIKFIITEFTKMEPWDLKFIKFYRDGDSVLICGQNKLDIVGTDYYWNNVEVQLPRQKIEKSFLRLGDININFISFSIISISLCFTLIVAFIFKIQIYNFISTIFIKLCQKIKK